MKGSNSRQGLRLEEWQWNKGTLCSATLPLVSLSRSTEGRNYVGIIIARRDGEEEVEVEKGGMN